MIRKIILLVKPIDRLLSKFENIYNNKSYGHVLFSDYNNPISIVFYYIKVFNTAVIFACAIGILCVLLEFGKFWAIGVIIDATTIGKDICSNNILVLLPIFILIYGAIPPALLSLHTLFIQ